MEDVSEEDEQEDLQLINGHGADTQPSGFTSINSPSKASPPARKLVPVIPRTSERKCKQYVETVGRIAIGRIKRVVTNDIGDTRYLAEFVGNMSEDEVSSMSNEDPLR